MKDLSWINKIVFFLNIVLAVLSFAGYLFPFLAPKVFPLLAVCTLFLPFLLILNFLFFSWWALQIKRQAALSGMVLLLGITFISKCYKFRQDDYALQPADFKVMTYNVRLFNKFEWSEKRTVAVEISDFIKEKDPDILCIQEFSNAPDFDYSRFKGKFISFQGGQIKTAQAIFAKYPIINQGDLIFPGSDNQCIFADIVKGKDTIRIYNIHLESVRITKDVQKINNNIDSVGQVKSEMMLRRISHAFRKQQLQAEILKAHKVDCHYPIFICGDMNNSAFSYVYRTIRGDLNDSFEKAGKGFGKTYDFRYYPARIDYIFADKRFDVKTSSSYPEIVDSDHFPVMAVFSKKKEEP